MTKAKLGAKLVEELLARDLTEDELALLAESGFATDRAAVALREVVACLCILVRRQSGRNRKPTKQDVRVALSHAGLDARIQYAMAHDEYGRMVRRRNRLAIMD